MWVGGTQEEYTVNIDVRGHMNNKVYKSMHTLYEALRIRSSVNRVKVCEA